MQFPILRAYAVTPFSIRHFLSPKSSNIWPYLSHFREDCVGYRSERKGSWLSAAVSGESVLSVVFTKVFVCMQIYCKFSIVNGNVLSIQPQCSWYAKNQRTCSKYITFGCSKWSLRTSAHVVNIWSVYVVSKGLDILDIDILSECASIQISIQSI